MFPTRHPFRHSADNHSLLAPYVTQTIFVTSRKWSSTLISCVLQDSTARSIATIKFSHLAYPNKDCSSRANQTSKTKESPIQS